MKIAVIGTGYVGLVTGTVLAEIGHHVTCIDIDSRKVETLQQGISPIYEPGLEELLQKNISANRLSFTINHQEAFQNVDVIFIAVGTPQAQNGSANLAYIKQAARDIAKYIDHNVTVVMKSTVPVGTNDKVEAIIKAELQHPVMVHVVSNPEFLREGHAIHDTFNGDRIVIGSDDEESANQIEELFKPLQLPIVKTDRRSAEMIKYAANAFLAVKISYINEIANLCDELGADVNAVANGIGLDHRIGRAFLNAGIGYGGSCFPKDTEALAYLAKEHNTNLQIVQAAMDVNRKQKDLFVQKVVRYFNGDIRGKKIAVLGLAFKPNTDDMREAPSQVIIEQLVGLGAEVSVYDPIVKQTDFFTGLGVSYGLTIEECVQSSDAILLVTEWDEFLHLDWGKLGLLVKEKVVFDGRNALESNQLQEDGWIYKGIGMNRKTPLPVI